MKKLIFLLLFVSTVYGQEFPISPRLDSLGINVCWNLNISTSGTDLLTSTKIYAAVNRGILLTCQDYPALPKFDTVYIDSTMEGGALPADFDRAKECLLIFGDTLRIPMVPITVDSLYGLFGGSAEKNMKQYYETSAPVYFVIHDTTFSVHPKWRTGVDSLMIRVDYYAIDTVLTSDSSETSVRPAYREMIINAACAILEKMRGKDAGYWWKLYGRQ